jgi:hypothetical protein
VPRLHATSPRRYLGNCLPRPSQLIGIAETAGIGPGDAGLVYVQIAPPAGSGPEFVDTLLAGVRVR